MADGRILCSSTVHPQSYNLASLHRRNHTEPPLNYMVWILGAGVSTPAVPEGEGVLEGEERETPSHPIFLLTLAEPSAWFSGTEDGERGRHKVEFGGCLARFCYTSRPLCKMYQHPHL
ncbi:hypothetical protein CFC21_063758 [Triticum aestivum]|uniref:Uncharacterized protein n=2 Tax=Triticum aestivum TaxID=4565 RepID=A0A3B6K945_WHEAT|nr:hypothetical protein CFC21_063758 [Triticum aestivum]